MTTFTIDEYNQIVVVASPEEAAVATPTPFDTFSSQEELAELAAHWPGQRVLAIWNSLPGVNPVKKFQDRKTAVRRIWERIQSLEVPSAPQAASAGAAAAQNAPVQERPKRKASCARRRHKAETCAVAAIPAPREGSKMAQVIALLRRKNGASLTEIVEKMGWQKHTVRGFMAGTLKKAGYTVESFKPEGGTRSYRLPQ